MLIFNSPTYRPTLASTSRSAARRAVPRQNGGRSSAERISRRNSFAMTCKNSRARLRQVISLALVWLLTLGTANAGVLVSTGDGITYSGADGITYSGADG